MESQEELRKKLYDLTYAFRQKTIEDRTGIPKEIISKYMYGKTDLYPEHYKILKNYLDNY